MTGLLKQLQGIWIRQDGRIPFFELVPNYRQVLWAAEVHQDRLPLQTADITFKRKPTCSQLFLI